MFFFLNISLLLLFKYTNFVILNINSICNKLGYNIFITEKNLILPIGLSFYIFQSCTYLTSIYRNKIKLEKNFLLYASFVSFFPTILSGPIQKAHELLPQIKNPSSFNYEEAKKGIMLFIWGFFEKVIVSTNLSLIVNKIYGNMANYNNIFYIIAAVCFSLYIYADFSSYSDMARGISKIMGININKNFNNPYLSTSTSEFWNRWHISLNEWFIDNVYIPLGGNRKGKIRKYFNVLIIFFISGLWHGASWNFIFWGVINGIIVILGQIIKPLKDYIYKKIKVDQKIESIVYVKRIIVFILISFTWIFFQNDINTAFIILKNIGQTKMINLFEPSIFEISGNVLATFITFITTLIFCKIQIKRQDESKLFKKFNSQPELFQILILSFVVTCCVFATFIPNAEVNTQFLYFQF